MEQLITKFDKIYIDRAAESSRLAKRLISLFPGEKIEVVSEKPLKNLEGSLSASEFNQSKRRLFVTPFRGQFFKRCPGAKPTLACCNYFVLNLGLQCDMNCSYCYLQSYINTPVMTIYSNLEDAIGELKEMAKTIDQAPLRIGTGETIDSLSLDPLTLYSRELIEFFREVPNWRLEFKTKSDYVDQFLDVSHAKNVIVSWSINPQAVIDHEEHGTASLDKRLKAARKCLDGGFQIAFHIDPMIWHSEWEKNYKQLVETIHAQFRPDEIPYFSLGALRFQPEQRHMMRERFSMQSWVTRAEMFASEDGKMRYDRELRNQMFNTVIQHFKSLDPNWRIFLCMETPESWLGTYQATPMKIDELKDLFRPPRTGVTTPAKEMR